MSQTISIKPKLAAGPDPEVSDRPKRQTFTAAYSLAIPRELDGCTESGSIGAVLRREGLYSGHITSWRRAREEGILNALAPKAGRTRCGSATAVVRARWGSARGCPG